MTRYTLETINPFYAARIRRAAAYLQAKRQKPLYARLPAAPQNGSPVPHLTSLYHFHRAGDYGNRRYPGNCGGNLIKDLLLYFRPKAVFDPMAGSGTCQDVCHELGIPCTSWDIHQGFDACDSKDFPSADTFDFIWRTRPTGGRNSTPATLATCHARRRSSSSSSATVCSSKTLPTLWPKAVNSRSSWATTATAKRASCPSSTTPSAWPSSPG